MSNSSPGAPADRIDDQIDARIDDRITLEIVKDYLHFSSGHFTIFSATSRENLHGHNFFVGCTVEAEVGDDGLCFDYSIIKRQLEAFCEEFDERMLLPGRSPHLSIDRDGDMIIARFAEERIPFLARDALILPVRNVTIEELARHITATLAASPAIAALAIHTLTIKVSSGPGQWAAFTSTLAP